MRNREIKDKKCNFCPKLILRASSSCQSCWQKGDKSIQWNNAKPICLICGKQKEGYNKGAHKSCRVNNQHFAWKENPGYGSLHDWVRRRLGKANYCSNSVSHKAKRYVWGNISGQYKRELADWHSLCNSCNLTDGIKIPQRFIYA